jgi:hypothetical protein
MKRSLPLLCLLLCGCVTERQIFIKDLPSSASPIYISSIGGSFPIEGLFDGTFQAQPDSIEVTFPSAEIRVRPLETYNGDRQIVSVKVGLGRPLADGKWDGFNWIELAAINRRLRVGDRMTFAPPRPIQIPVGSSMDLAKHWIIVRIDSIPVDRPKEQQRVGYSYAHSPRDVFVSAKAR